MITLTKKVQDRMRIQKNKLFKGDQKQLLNTRPVLDAINEHPDGHLEITNTLSAVRLSNVLEPMNAPVANGYPELNHLFELPANPVATLSINPETLETATKESAKDTDLLMFNIQDDNLKITPKKVNDSSIINTVEVKTSPGVSQEISFILHPRFFNDAMNFFRMLGIKDVTLMIEAENKPIRFLHKNSHYLIAPILYHQ